MPMLCPSIPIDKNKKGGRNYDSSKLTDFKKICLISNDDTTKPNQQTDRIELRRGAMLASTLLTIPGFVPITPYVPPPLSYTEGVLAGTPANKITLILATYGPVGGSGGQLIPGILTASAAYGINWYYVYLDCNPTWFNSNLASFWCDGPGLNNQTEVPGVATDVITFSNGAVRTSPSGINNFWIVTDDGAGRSIHTSPSLLDVANSIPLRKVRVQQVDYVTTTGTAARPDTRAGTFIRNAFLQRSGGIDASRNITTTVLDTPAFFV